MKTSLLTDFVIDQETNTIRIVREFAAPLEQVWAAWTQSALLDQWWAPKPWRVQTKSMDFVPGGSWLYAMIGPNGETHWSKAVFREIDPMRRYSSLDAFCDEWGNVKPEMPRATWENEFTPLGNATQVRLCLQYETLAELQQIVAMGFEEGITSSLRNLDAYLAAQR